MTPLNRIAAVWESFALLSKISCILFALILTLGVVIGLTANVFVHFQSTEHELLVIFSIIGTLVIVIPVFAGIIVRVIASPLEKITLVVAKNT